MIHHRVRVIHHRQIGTRPTRLLTLCSPSLAPQRHRRRLRQPVRRRWLRRILRVLPQPPFQPHNLRTKLRDHRILDLVLRDQPGHHSNKLDIIAELDRGDTAKHAGYTRLSALIAEILHIRRTRASYLIKQAERIAETVTPTGHVTPAPLPAMRAALHAGLVDGEHLDEVAKAMKALPDWVSVADRELVETTLAHTAESANPTVVLEHD